MNNQNAWRDFKEGIWCDSINVSNFIKMNYTPYDGDSSFLEGPTERTEKEMKRVKELLIAENQKGGVLDVDANAFSSSLMPNPVENIYFESPEDGEYWVYVINYHDRTDGSATNYLVRLQVGDEVQTFSGTLTNEDESAEIVGFRYTAD